MHHNEKILMIIDTSSTTRGDVSEDESEDASVEPTTCLRMHLQLTDASLDALVAQNVSLANYMSVLK